jgi:hypothetical protein
MIREHLGAGENWASERRRDFYFPGRQKPVSALQSRNAIVPE